MKTTKGFTLNRLVTTKAVRLISIALMMVLPATFFGGCAVGQVVQPFSPKKVNPSPYNPEPVWNANTDPTLLAIQGLKRKTGQTTPPGGATTAALTPGGTPGGVAPVPGPIPGPTPGPQPTPGGRVPSTLDSIFGYVYDRVEGGVIPGAIVELYDRRGALVDAIMTDSTGLYSFTSATIFSGSSYKVSASANGYSVIPLSEFEFIYPLVTLPINLQLAYNYPFQELPGGSYTSLGFTATATTGLNYLFNNDAYSCGLYGDVMPTDFWSGGLQKTFKSVLFDYKGTQYGPGFVGLIDCSQRSSRAFAQYTFYLPDPLTNHYSYDGLWVTLPDSYVVTGGLWSAGGTGTVFYFDWTAGLWQEWGSTASLSFAQPPFWSIKNTTDYTGLAGQVNIIVLSDQDVANPPGEYVLTKIKLAYDYHKDTSRPTISSSYFVSVTGNIITQVQENAYVYLNYVNSAGTAQQILIPIEADRISVFHPSDGVQLGSTYSIFLLDQAGNTSPVTYSYVAL